MITWLASYPRSGNTLMRTIFNACFGLRSYELNQGPGLSPAARKRIGHCDITTAWADFYEEAKRSHENIIIKTHNPPLDLLPAVYVIRDGRASCYSYYRYHLSFQPELGRSLLQIIVGDDHYGNWSEHFRNWNKESRPVLLLRYENLIRPTDETLNSIAEFLDFRGKLSPWRNPFSELKEQDPNFFRSGNSEWRSAPEWNRYVDKVFWLFHSELMHQMGYGEEDEPELGSDLANILKELGSIIRRQARKSRELQRVCDERLDLINSLHDEAQKRLRIIEQLQSTRK